MSAVKIIFKRSSLLGKRPTGANLAPGEIGLNTNSNDPGLFFEVADGSVVKAGPTSYLSEAPTQLPARGELWVDSDTKALSIGDEEGNWKKVAAPFLGGTNGLTVFVAPDYQNATDSLANDGQTVPFVTINRAIIEVTKQIIKDTLAGVSLGNNRYLIVLAPGQHCVVNAPGQSVTNFSVDFNNPYTEVTQQLLSQFNPEGVGGLILPRGVSIIGLDLKKCEIHPTYVPKYTHPAFPPGYQQQTTGPVYQNEPISAVFRWSGNTYVSNFTGLDKVDYRIVTSVTKQEETNWAIFKTNRSHGLGFNDFVQVSYTNSADQVNTFTEGAYYAYPLTSNTFVLSLGSWGSANENPVLWTNLPSAYFLSGASGAPKFNVWNIYPYYIPQGTNSYELSSYSHHRLSVIKNASIEQLNTFYIKVQKAFSNFFLNQVNSNLVSAPEYDIVAPTAGEYPNNLPANSTDNTSPYQNMVNHRSDYGMANGDYDGDSVNGFKSVIINSATAVILQKDPVAYELFATGQNWVQLTEYTKQQDKYLNTPITSIPTNEQLQLLNAAPIPNIRYYYTNLTVIDPDSSLPKSIGIPDPNNDFRHFGFRIQGPNSYMQAQSTYTIGAAIACWAKNGAIISLTNATTNFGSVAFQSEGFAGINTLGGANPINKGFLLSGIVRPLSLLEDSAVSDQQKRILSLGSKVVGVGLDPNDPLVQHIYLQRPFDPASILPYSLKPGSAVFTTDAVCTYRAFFVTDGSPTCVLSADGVNWTNPYSSDGGILRVRVSDSTVPTVGEIVNALDIPYIRRFVDPRTPTEKSYAFYVQSTNPPTQAPQLGSVLRLNQGSQSLSSTIKRNVQFDPGLTGGISQVFTVDTVETGEYSRSANFNYKVSDSSQGTNYAVYASLTDASTPWVQSVPSDPADLTSPLVPSYNPQGAYITYGYKNYYAAENNLWTSLYYYTGNTAGPTKAAPDQADSPFVITSVLENTELVVDSWQGDIPDPYYNYYVNGIPAPYNSNLSYMRGAVTPYTEYGPQYQVDDDDSSNSMGIIFTRLPLDADPTVLVAESTTKQTPLPMLAPWEVDRTDVDQITFGRPEIIQLELLSVQQVVLPKEGVSVLQLSNPAIKGLEYVRVISVTSNVIQAIRNCYPEYAVYSNGQLPTQWPKGTTVRVCTETGFPEPSMYDPDWAVTKATMFRFFQLMGYSFNKIAPYLKPQYYGERILLNTSLPLVPVNGYANVTTAWPIEFNNPSAIIANTHTWQYVGYFDYSRGLPKYQVNEIPKKLSYDFLSMTTWGGRLTVMGANETGQLVFLGPIKEALTGQFYLTESPLSNAADKQVYQSPEPVTLPNPVLVYSADDISGDFDGSSVVFPLQRGGYDIPLNQVGTYSVFVTLGGVIQKPFDAYYIQGETAGVAAPLIVFTEAPLKGTSCDIRIVTTGDNSETLEVIPFDLSPAFDGAQTSFQIGPVISSLNDLNSFVFLGGTEQNPAGPQQNSAAYTIQTSSTSKSLSFTDGTPQAGTVLDFRGILSGERYRNAGVSTVFVASADDLSTYFDNTLTTFPLEIDGIPLDPTKVNAQNMFVSLGGVMQIPIAQAEDTAAGNAYSVQQNSTSNQLEITFSVPPAAGTTCNIRIVTSEEFLTCPISPELFNTTLQDGPGIIVNEQNQIIEIDSGLIN